MCNLRGVTILLLDPVQASEKARQFQTKQISSGNTVVLLIVFTLALADGTEIS